MKTKHNFMKKLMLFAAAFAFCAAICTKPVDVKAAVAAPTVKQIGATNSMIAIEWDAVPGAVTYGVQYSTAPTGLDAATELFVDNATLTQGAIPNLTAGTTYYIRMRAYSSNTEFSAWSNVITADTAPNNITSITQTNATETTVSFSWSPVAGATGYSLYQCLPNGTYQTPFTTTTATSYTMTVPKNSLYFVTVVPTRNGYAFPVDNNTLVETYCVPSPTKPGNLNVINGNPDTKTLEFYWKPTSIAENTDGYEIEVYQLKTNGKTKRISKKAIARSSYEYYGCDIKHKSLFNNACRFRVRSYMNLNGKKVYSAWSAYKNYVPQAYQTKLTFHSRSTATLKWNKVNGATSYDIYYKSSKYGKWSRIAKNVKGTSHSVKGNYYGDSYYYVKANKVKFGKKKLNSTAPTQAPYVIYWN